MRNLWMLLALAGVSACNKASPDRTSVTQTALTYDGASAKHRAALIAHGERLSRVLGCRGCHGEKLQGELFDDNELGTLWASNISLLLPKLDDAALRNILQKGVRPDGSEVWVMPSEMYRYLSDPDRDALIAYLRTVPPGGKPTPRPTFREAGRKLIASGELKTAAAYIREEQDIAPFDAGAAYSKGRMITMTACTECHGAKLEGTPGDTPDLDIAAAYSDAQFATLMRTGKPSPDRKLQLMDQVAIGRFSHFTDAEVSALHDYLKARANRPSPDHGAKDSRLGKPPASR